MSDNRVTPKQASAAMKSIDDELEGVNTVDPRYARHTLRCFITQQQPVDVEFPCCGGNDEDPPEHCMDCPDLANASPPESGWQRDHKGRPMTYWGGLASEYESDGQGAPYVAGECDPSERDNESLVDLTMQLHYRAVAYGNKAQHDACNECREELLRRLATGRADGEKGDG